MWAVVAHDELAVGGRVDVELDEVCAELDRPLEGRESVLGQLPAGATVRDDERQRRSLATTAGPSASTSSSAAARRSGVCVPTTATQ